MGKNNMTFYQAMQLGAERLKPMIKNEEDKKTKQKYLGAFILKNILCILDIAKYSDFNLGFISSAKEDLKNNFNKYKEVYRRSTYYYLNLENTEDALEISEKIYLQTKVDSIITENICLVGVKSKNF